MKPSLSLYSLLGLIGSGGFIGHLIDPKNPYYFILGAYITLLLVLIIIFFSGD
ncbi:MAG: hypothetical protein R3321_14985 [Nitrososphaeraceae archaeon]|nr:hypothetical protein [Nitrososphaeraceae archaeon]